MTATRGAATAPTTQGSVAVPWGHLIGVGAFLVVVVFVPPWPEAFTLPKAIVATALALATIPLLVVRRSVVLAERVPLGLAGLFLLLALASQALSGAPQAVSFWGEWSRRSGTVTAVALVLLLAAAAVLTRREARNVILWLVGAGIPASLYGLVQVVGADPFEWNNVGWVVSTFGNPNFAAAGLAMLALLTGGVALLDDRPMPWRIGLGALALLESFLALRTGSSQGLFALAAGLAVAALVLVSQRLGPRRVVASMVLVGVMGLGALATILGILGTGPLTRFVSSETLMFREWYWSAAVGMAKSHPILGVGPDGYGRYYGEFRPLESIEMPTLGASAAHDVPLQWAATLGVPAALAYVALMVVVLAVVARRVWHAGPEGSWLVVPVAAAWTAYQVQSLVSIDATAVAVLGWMLTGLLLAVTRPEGAADAPSATTTPTWVAAGVVGLVGVLLWLPAVLASNASKAVVQGTTEADVLRAVSLVESTVLPCEPSTAVARWMISVAPSEPTVNGTLAGADADDRCYGLVNGAADLAIQLGDADKALAYAQQAVTIDPLNYSVWLLLARAEHLAGDDEGAVTSLERATQLNVNADAEVAELAAVLGVPWSS